MYTIFLLELRLQFPFFFFFFFGSRFSAFFFFTGELGMSVCVCVCAHVSYVCDVQAYKMRGYQLKMLNIGLLIINFSKIYSRKY